MRHFQLRSSTSYQRELKQVQGTRERLARQWRKLPEPQVATLYQGEAGRIHKALVSRLLSESPTGKKERQQGTRLAKSLPDDLRERDGVGRLLAAMLYNRAYELPRFYALETLPGWLLPDYMQYMTNPALLFCAIDESLRYLEHMRRWVAYLHRSIGENPTSPFWRNIANLFVRHADFGPLYFNDANLAPIYTQRGDIIEQALRANGYSIDYDFPPKAETRPLRIGIVALHCGPSPETYAMLPVFEYPEDDLEVTLYVLHSGKSSIEEYCRSRIQTLKVLPADLKTQATYIRADDLDVLFFATNVTAACNPVCLLAAHRLARVQVAGPGSVTTTGLRHMDYYLTGRLTDQPRNAAHYRESLLWLDGPAHCFSYGTSTPTNTFALSRTALGIPDGVTVYASGANLFKILPEVMRVWAKVLSAQPGSVLMLYPFGPNWSSSYPKELFAQRLIHHLERGGISAQRLFLLDPEPVPDRHQIREYLRVADVYLDSLPFSGTTSLIEPLEIGLPVVSRRGITYRASMGAALLETLGLHGLVADSDDAYIALAQRLGEDTAWRQLHEDKIRAAMQANPAFLDSAAYSRQVSRLFRRITRGTS